MILLFRNKYKSLTADINKISMIRPNGSKEQIRKFQLEIMGRVEYLENQKRGIQRANVLAVFIVSLVLIIMKELLK